MTSSSRNGTQTRSIRKIESGMVRVNNVVISDPRVRFGGIKNSGFGRELLRYEMLEFVISNQLDFMIKDNIPRERYP